MAQPVSPPQDISAASRVLQVFVMGAAGLGVALVVGALVLWFHWGTTVFFEMVASGIAACF